MNPKETNDNLIKNNNEICANFCSNSLKFTLAVNDFYYIPQENVAAPHIESIHESSYLSFPLWDR